MAYKVIKNKEIIGIISMVKNMFEANNKFKWIKMLFQRYKSLITEFFVKCYESLESKWE